MESAGTVGDVRRRDERGEASPGPVGVGRRRGKPSPRARAASERERPATKRAGRDTTKAVPPPSAEEMLRRALLAPTPRSRALWARRGLSLRGAIDRSTQAMLLRQLYLAYFEERRFERAAEISEQMVELGVLLDVAHQDAARARQAQGDVEGAIGHLRLAARTGPASRRAFHWWTLGSVYHLAGRHEEAVAALARAARWGTTDKPLYQGHLAVVRCERGERVPELGELIERLAEAPGGQGYGRFVLGHLAYHDRRWDEARRYLEAFVRRSTAGRPALVIALAGEVARARETLATLPST